MTNNTTDATDDVMDTTRLLWLPGVVIGLSMIIFLSLSFLSYHRKFLRKQELALEYASLNLNIKRPRIAVCLCSTNNIPYDDLVASMNSTNSQNPEDHQPPVCEATNDNSKTNVFRPIAQKGDNDFFSIVSDRKCNDITELLPYPTAHAPKRRHSCANEKYNCSNSESDFDFKAETSFSGYSNKGYVVDHNEIEMHATICPRCGHRFQHYSIDADCSSGRYPASGFVRHFPVQGDEQIVEDAFHKPLRYTERPKLPRTVVKKKDPIIRTGPQWSLGNKKTAEGRQQRRGSVFWIDIDNGQQTMV